AMTIAQARILPRARLEHLLREAALFLGLSYVLLLGGTFNGLVLYRLNVASLVLIAAVGLAWLGWRWRRAARRPVNAVDFGMAAGWAIAASVILFFTSSRGGWLGTAAGVAALALLAGYERRSAVRGAWQALRRRPWLVAGIVVAALALVVAGAAVVYIESQHP